jgi:hypothetical protein
MPCNCTHNKSALLKVENLAQTTCPLAFELSPISNQPNDMTSFPTADEFHAWANYLFYVCDSQSI